ncbi:MAG: hypothetical protein ACI33L_00110 [Limosilactobacillus sp.]|uniref:hypothetical protein n=1 Tax=Limosilactobacillus sp. TaxID=2773925 RepID=UPI003F092379
MRRKNHRNRWGWWLIGTLAVLALVLGTWGVMRPSTTSEDVAEPKTAAPKKAKKKTTEKKEKKRADKAEKANNESADTGTTPAANNQGASGTPASGTNNSAPSSSGTTTAPGQGTINGNTGNQTDDDLSYDAPASTAAGTTVGAELNNLVAELNKLAGQYTEYQDVAAFNSGLASVQARNNQLLAQSTTWADRNLATKINGTIERMRADPENAQYIVGHIWH